MKEKTLEELASKFHDIYQKEANRQDDVRHTDKYEDLPENIKEFDRVLVRYVFENYIPKAEVELVIEEAKKKHTKEWNDVSRMGGIAPCDCLIAGREEGCEVHCVLNGLKSSLFQKQGLRRND